MPNTSRPAALLIDQGRETGNAQGPNGLSPTQNRNNQPSLALHSPSQSSSRPSSSRSSSRPSTPKWVPPALEQKLQHYRDNPVALRQLNQRVKQYSRPSSPRKTPTAAAAAVQAAPPWTISSHPLDSTSTASCSNCQPPDVMFIDHEAGCAEQNAPATETSALSYPGQRQSSATPLELDPDPQPLQQYQAQQQDERLLLTQDPAMRQQQQLGVDGQVHGVRGLQTELELQQQLQQPGHPQPQQHEQHEQVPLPLSHHPSTSTGLQDTSQAACQHSSCDAALQLQLLIEEHEQQQQQAPAGTEGQGQLSTPEVWQHIQAAQLHQHANLIQRSWRDELVVRAAQQQLLCRAMLQLEQQLVRNSAAAAAAAARAEARAQLTAGAAGRATMHPIISTSSNSAMTRAHSATRTAASAAAVAAAGLEDGHCSPAHDTAAAAAADKDSPSSAPTAAAAAAGGRVGRSAAPQPWRRGGPLVLPGDFFDAVDGLEEDSHEGSSSNTPPSAAAAPAGVGGSAAAAGAFRTVTAVAAAAGGQRRPQSACPQPTAAAAAATAATQQHSSSSSRRPQSARSPLHSAPRPQSAAASSRPASAVAAGSGATGRNQKGGGRQSLDRPTSAAPAAAAAGGNAVQHQQHQGSATAAGSRPGSAAPHNHIHSSSRAQHHRTGRTPATAATAEPAAAAAAVVVVSEAAAALPQGPMPHRGVQMSGQLTPLTAGPDSAGNWAAFAPPGTAAAAACVGGVPAASGSIGEPVLALGSSRSLEQQQQGRVRQRAGGGGGGVGWQQEGVVDLEIEAQLKRLTEVLPDNIRQQVAAGQLAAARRQLLQARAAHQELVVRTRQQRATEAALHTTLTAVTGTATLTASKVAPLHPRPHLQLIPNRPRLKQMVAAGITLQQQRMLAAATADSDTAGLETSPFGSSSANGSSGGGGGSRGVSANGGLSSGGGRWNG